MDYTSTLEGLKGLWYTFTRCSEHQIRSWAILYPLVKDTVLRIAHCSEQDTLFTLSQL